jgi:hypothetical protein
MKKNDNILLIIILIVAAILRFWDFFNIPFMHDELSALVRTHYNSFSDLINYGVKTDMHPAGVQVFLFYWIKIFGDKEFVVKFPFIISGLLAIYFTYKVAGFWFNNTVGLIVSAFMAGIQYMVMYSQIARPYVSGMFFSVLMVWCWTNLLFGIKIQRKKWWIFYVLSSALCAYDQHFDFLFAITVGLTGLFFLNKENWKMYLLAGISIIILYLPHINILFYQLSKGGVGGEGGWLGRPSPDWILSYMKYVFNFSYWLYGLVVILLLVSLIKQSDKILQQQKFRIIAISWFLIHFFIGYIYSSKVNPVLQYSTLIFVFPFLLMFLFSLLKEMNARFKIIITVVILAFTSCTLIFERQHYKVFYKEPFEQIVLNTNKTIDQLGDTGKCTIELFMPPAFGDYYFKKYNKKFNYIFFNGYENNINYKKFNEFVRNLKTDYFICGNLPLEYFQIIRKYYPYIKSKDEGFTCDFYCFSKKKSDDLVHEKNVFSNKNIDDQKNKVSAVNDNTMKAFYYGNGACAVDSNNEYTSAPLKIKFKDIISSAYGLVNISVNITAKDTSADPVLVFDLSTDGKSIIWAGANYKKYRNNDSCNSVFLSQMIFKNDLLKYPDAILNIYIWNHTKSNIRLSDFSVEATEYNPYIYGLYEPL